MTTLLLLELALFPFTLVASLVTGVIACSVWYIGMVIYEEVKYGKEN